MRVPLLAVVSLVSVFVVGFAGFQAALLSVGWYEGAGWWVVVWVGLRVVCAVLMIVLLSQRSRGHAVRVPGDAILWFGIGALPWVALDLAAFFVGLGTSASIILYGG